MLSNFIYVFCFLNLLMIISCGAERICTTDQECKLDECCILKFTGDKTICKDMGDDVGDVCGGDYFCSRCSDDLICMAIENKNVDPYICPFPANGTCQPPPQFPPIQNSAINFDQILS